MTTPEKIEEVSLTVSEKPAKKKAKKEVAVKVAPKKEPVKAGAQVKLLVGTEKGKLFTVKKVAGSKVYLDGYKLIKRTVKVSQENPNNYKTVHHYVHISNVTTKIDK